MRKLSQLEKQMILKLNCRTHPVLDRLMLCVTKMGNGGLVWIIISLVLIWNRRAAEGVLTLIALAITAFLINLIIKPMFTRKRPYELIQSIRTKLNPPFGSSFPSGHAASSFAAASMLWLMNAPLWSFAVVLACLIAVSRVYLFVHFPSDVLVGAVLGVAISYATYVLAGRIGGQVIEEWLEQHLAWHLNQISLTVRYLLQRQVI